MKLTGRHTRGAVGQVMQVKNLRTDTGRKAFSFQGPTMWNSLLVGLRSISVFEEFKKAVSEQVHDLFGDHPT